MSQPRPGQSLLAFHLPRINPRPSRSRRGAHAQQLAVRGWLSPLAIAVAALAAIQALTGTVDLPGSILAGHSVPGLAHAAAGLLSVVPLVWHVRLPRTGLCGMAAERRRFSAMNPSFQAIQKNFAADRGAEETRYSRVSRPDLAVCRRQGHSQPIAVSAGNAGRRVV